MTAAWTDPLGQTGRSNVNKLLDCLAYIKASPATAEQIAAGVGANVDVVRNYLYRARDRGIVEQVVQHRRGCKAVAAQWSLTP